MGTLNIIKWCTENGNPHPAWSQYAGSVFVSFHSAVLPTVKDTVEVIEDISVEVSPEVTPEVTPEVLLLSKLKGEMSRRELLSVLGLKDEEHFRKHYILPALEAGLIEMTIPEKPRSRKQR